MFFKEIIFAGVIYWVIMYIILKFIDVYLHLEDYKLYNSILYEDQPKKLKLWRL